MMVELYVSCVCLHVVVSNTYCVVFLICLSSACVSYVAISLDCPLFDGPFGILKRLFVNNVIVTCDVRNNIAVISIACVCSSSIARIFVIISASKSHILYPG